MHAARGLLHLCRKPGCHGDKWQRPTEMTNVTWTSEQLAILVNAADSQDPEVVLQVLLGTRSVCTPSYISIMLGRTNILSMLVKAMRGNLFRENFPLLMAAVLVLSTLSQACFHMRVCVCVIMYLCVNIVTHTHTPWFWHWMIRDADCVVQGSVGGRRFPSDTQGAFEFDAKDTRTSSQYAGMRREYSSNQLVHFSYWFRKRLQSAKGVMSTWDEATLAQKARILTHSPEATMGAVAEVFPQVYFVWS